MNAPAMLSAGPRPVDDNERIDAVDVLRGFALFGILLVNIGFFAHPVSEPFFLAADASAADRAVHTLIAALAQGKFYPLFSFLFGFGFAIQFARGEARGDDITPLYVRRLFVLLMIGLLHGMFIWAGDILAAYAVLGFVLVPFVRVPVRTLLLAAAATYAVQLLFIAGFTLSLAGVQADARVAETVLLEMTAGMNEAAALRADAWAAYANGSWFDIMNVRLREYAVALQNMVFFAPQVFAMFLAGAACARAGLLSHPQRFRRHLKVMLTLGVVAGLPLAVWFARLNADIDYLGAPTVEMGSAYVLNLLAGPLLAFAYVAAIALGLQTRMARALVVLAPVGRMALSNYLLQSVVCTLLFYSYGLGWFGELGATELAGVVFVVFAAQVALSHLWLGRYRFGPAEWAWRSLTYLKRQPMKRSPPGQAISAMATSSQRRG